MVAFSGATTSSLEGESTVGNPRSLAAMFWKQLSRGQVGIVEEVVRQINPPLVTVFPFGDNTDQGGEQGESDALVLTDTPSTVTDNVWNSTKKVSVLLVEEGGGVWPP